MTGGVSPPGLVLSEEGAKEMGEPSPEALPRCPPLFVDTVGEIERVFLVALEHISQLACYVLVKDGEVHLIVTFEAARIEVCRAYSAVSAIDHDNLRMMEAGLVDPYLASLLLQLVTVIEDTVRCKGYIAWRIVSLASLMAW